MPPRQPCPERSRTALPRRWLITDERFGDGLPDAIERLGADGGIVFRHYSLGKRERRGLFDRVRAAHPGLLLLAGPASQAAIWGADGSHGPGRGTGLRSAPVHSYGQIRAAERNGAALLFLSPVFTTRSHPEARPLGLARFAWLARRTPLPVIALGGMDERRGLRLASFGAYGWAGIDAFLPGSLPTLRHPDVIRGPPAFGHFQGGGCRIKSGMTNLSNFPRSGRRCRYRRPGCRAGSRAAAARAGRGRSGNGRRR